MNAPKPGRRPRHIIVREYDPNPDACVRAATILVDWWIGRADSSSLASATGVGQTLPAAEAPTATPETLR